MQVAVLVGLCEAMRNWPVQRARYRPIMPKVASMSAQDFAGRAKASSLVTATVGTDVVAALKDPARYPQGGGSEWRSHDAGQAVTDDKAAGRRVLRVEEFLPCPKGWVWRALTDPDLI
jgi:hypothetical protein